MECSVCHKRGTEKKIIFLSLLAHGARAYEIADPSSMRVVCHKEPC